MTNNIVQVYLCTTKEHLNFKNIFNYTSCTGYILYLMYNMEYRFKQTGIWHTKRQVLPSYAEENQNLKESLCLKLLTCCPIHAIHEPYVDKMYRTYFLCGPHHGYQRYAPFWKTLHIHKE